MSRKVRVWMVRKDGVRQRYWVREEIADKYIREKEVKKIERIKRWRITFDIRSEFES